MSMSPENQSSLPDIRIAYHADGSATVNGVPVTVEPGQDVRDAAYQAAVGLVVAAGASGPVGATSVEADGTEYPLTLYPLKAVAAANALVNAAADTDPASGASPVAGDDAAGLAIGAVGGFDDQYRRARRAWYRPTLSMSWLVAGACACMMLSVLATVLLRENDPSLVRLSVDTENEAGHSSAAHAIGRAVASERVALPGPTAAKASASKHPATPTASPHADASAHTSAAGAVAGNAAEAGGDANGDGTGNTSGDVSQPSRTIPKPVPSPKPRSAPGNPASAQVTNLTVTLIGGDKTDLTIAYVITVATSNTNPVTLTYTYAGKGGRAPIRRSVVLSGQTSYALADLILAQPYCGGQVTMTASTSPVAGNGAVTAATQPGC